MQEKVVYAKGNFKQSDSGTLKYFITNQTNPDSYFFIDDLINNNSVLALPTE